MKKHLHKPKIECENIMPTTKQLIDAALSKRRAPKRGRGTVDSGSRKPH